MPQQKHEESVLDDLKRNFPDDFPMLLQKWEKQQITAKDLLKKCNFSESTLYRRANKMRLMDKKIAVKKSTF